eukprot:maker-scaffold730_size105374-snap-gene-0.21 protein:Tk06149 transcript:maker-scaffold730_size105374-snap-gene-0.21-mRNA-1 annotation:"PREDICTED: uncharacterized protein LOC103035284 isoform X1"
MPLGRRHVVTLIVFAFLAFQTNLLQVPPDFLTTVDPLKWSPMLSAWYQHYEDFWEWLDEVLPPIDDEDWFEDEEEDGSEAFTLEIMGQRLGLNGTDYFSMSKRPRRVRPRHLMFKVGQVVDLGASNPELEDEVLANALNEANPLSCVIIGWDKKLKAPLPWIEMVYGSDFESWLSQPHYALICDSPLDSSGPEDEDFFSQYSSPSPVGVGALMLEELHYVAQSEIKLKSTPSTANLGNHQDFRISSSFVGVFFTRFSEHHQRYVMRPWLRKLYPQDV